MKFSFSVQFLNKHLSSMLILLYHLLLNFVHNNTGIEKPLENMKRMLMDQAALKYNVIYQ